MTKSLTASAGSARTRPLASQLMRGGVWVIFGRVLTSGGTFAISLVLARLLPPEGVGGYFLALSLATGISILCRFGLDRVALARVSRLVAADELGLAFDTIRVILRLAVLSSAAVVIAIVLTGPWVLGALFADFGIRHFVLLTAVWSAAIAAEALLADVFRGLNRIPAASLFGGAVSRALTLTAFIVVGFAASAAEAHHVISLAILGTGITIAIGLMYLQLLAAQSPTRAEGAPEPVSLIREALPLVAGNLGLFVMTSVDLWIAGAFLPASEVGLYAVAARLVLLVGSSVTIANAVLPPIIARLLAEKDTPRTERVLRGVASLAAIPSGTILLLYIAAGPRLLSVLFGSEYASAWTVLAVLSVGQLFAVWAGSCGYLLVISGNHRVVMWTSLVGAIAATIGGLLMARPFGAVGIACACSAGLALQQVLMLVAARRTCGVWTHAGVRPLFSSARSALSALRQ